MKTKPINLEVLSKPPCVLTPVGLEFTGRLTYETYKKAVEVLNSLDGSMLWAWGDLLTRGEAELPDRCTQPLEGNMYRYGTLANAAYVAGRIPVSRRRENLSYSHHQTVASLEPKEQDRLLDLAEKEKLTVKALRNVKRSPSVQEMIKNLDAEEEEIVEKTRTVLANQAERERERKARFNRTTESVDWAKWTWNPVTGCETGCQYCYARDFANRFQNGDFSPKFHEDRLFAPFNTHAASEDKEEPEDPGERAVFVSSMGDLFGPWVPDEWIKKVLDATGDAPDWTFLFLTKYPDRLVKIKWPENAWVGTTVDKQERVKPAVEAFKKIKAKVRFLSCEPMLEELFFPAYQQEKGTDSVFGVTSSLSLFDWVIMGGMSPSFLNPTGRQPEWDWVDHLYEAAKASGCQVYWKPNLTVRPQEYPSISTERKGPEEGEQVVTVRGARSHPRGKETQVSPVRYATNREGRRRT